MRRTKSIVRLIFFAMLNFISLINVAQVNPAYSWLEGSWKGDGFDGSSEEVWSSPSADGKMMGVYRHHKADGSLNFYEFLILDEEGIRLKHFTPQLIGWEEKSDYVTFEMIRYDENTIEMKGLTFKRISPDKMEIYLKLMDDNGEIRTETFHMVRK